MPERIRPNLVERNIMEPDHATSEPILLRDMRDGVVTLRLNRPQQFNALSEAMLASLQDAFDSLAADARVRCVVLAAEGKAFCAGTTCARCAASPISTITARCSRNAAA